MSRRSDVFELAILGLLHDAPLHGYELRKRMTSVLGPLRAISYGSLYPALKDLVARGLITEDAEGESGGGVAALGRRSRIVYTLTADGKERFAEMVATAGPEAWDDEAFEAHLAFFGRTPAEARMRILLGRRSRLEERLATLRTSLARGAERMDDYTLRLQQHGLEGVEREVRWLSELIVEENQISPSPQPRKDTP